MTTAEYVLFNTKLKTVLVLLLGLSHEPSLMALDPASPASELVIGRS